MSRRAPKSRRALSPLWRYKPAARLRGPINWTLIPLAETSSVPATSARMLMSVASADRALRASFPGRSTNLQPWGGTSTAKSTSSEAVLPTASDPTPRSGSSGRNGRWGSPNSPRTIRRDSAGSIPGHGPRAVALTLCTSPDILSGLLAGDLVILCDGLVMADHFTDDEIHELLCKGGVEMRVLGRAAKPGDLGCFPSRVARGKLVRGLEDPYFLGGLEAFGEQENECGINVVDAGPDGGQLIHAARIHLAREGTRWRVEGIVVFGEGIVLLGHGPQSMGCGGSVAGVT